jgi:hypothetical protein
MRCSEGLSEHSQPLGDDSFHAWGAAGKSLAVALASTSK